MNKLQRFIKTKVGFTLVELMIVVAILGILIAVGVPAYTSAQKKGRIDACKATRDSVRHDLVVWAMQHPYNDSLSFKIESDGTKGTISDVSGGPSNIAKLFSDKIFKDGIPCCPCKNGTYTVTCSKSSTRKHFDIEITCDGGTDGENSHK